MDDSGSSIMLNSRPLTGNLSSNDNLLGKLSNAIYRGYSVQLRVDGTTLQYKYENEDDNSWIDLIDLQLVKDYEELINKPTINGNEIVGEVKNNFMTPSDALSNMEIEQLLN